MSQRFIGLASLLALLSIQAGSASGATIVNHSFEAQGVPTGPDYIGPGGNGLAGWDTTFAFGDREDIATAGFSGGTDGSVVLSPIGGHIVQNLGENFVVGSTYTLTIAAGALSSDDASDGVGFGFGTGGYDGSNQVVFLPGAVGFAGIGAAPRDVMADYVFTYTAVAGDELKPIVIAVTDFFSNTGHVDNVRLTVTPVPEPGMLGGLGAVMLLGLRRRSR